jgi:hypothetical protein
MSKASDILDKSTVIGRITPEEYWQMRFGQSEMQKANYVVLIKNLKQQLLEKDVLILHGKINNIKTDVRNAIQQENLAKKDYQDTRKQIGDRLGHELKGCIIDDVTLEVTRDEEDTPPSEESGELVMEDKQ